MIFSVGDNKFGPSKAVLLKKLPKRSFLARKRVFRALAAMRQGDSISRAARENGVTPRTIKRYAGTALVQDRPRGRIRATKSDRLIRYLDIPGPNGPLVIEVRGLKAASEFARYKAAVNRFLGGDGNALADWHGKKIAGIELITDGSTLKDLSDKDWIPYSLSHSFPGGAA